MGMPHVPLPQVRERAEVTRLLEQLAEGRTGAVESLFPLIYDELRALARRQLRRERAEHTLGATALVHEVYLKLVDQKRARWNSRAHFLAIAAQAMRRILINYAHRRIAAKRGGGEELVVFDDDVAADITRPEDLLHLNAALERLESLSARQARAVVYRFFGGMTQEETAQALGVSVQTVRLDWRMSRAWLKRELGRD